MSRHAVIPSLVIVALLIGPASVLLTASPAVVDDGPQAATAKAPAQPAKPAGPNKPPTFHINAYGVFALQQYAAKDSFEAVFGYASKSLFGGGAQLWHRSGLFVQGDYSKVTHEGERVFVSGGTVFPLGIPLRVELGFFEVGVGYKFTRKVRAPKVPAAPKAPAAKAPTKSGVRSDDVVVQRQPGRPAPATAAAPARPKAPSRFRLTPYVGGGVGRVSYAEAGDFSAAGENPSGTHTSYHALGGVEIPVWKWFGLNVEGLYRWVPDGLGEGGASAEFGETDLGGPAFRVKLTVGR